MVGEEGECRVLYDDDMQERLTLPRERFRWLAPRARSAGATPALYVRPGCPLVCCLPSPLRLGSGQSSLHVHVHVQTA